MDVNNIPINVSKIQPSGTGKEKNVVQNEKSKPVSGSQITDVIDVARKGLKEIEEMDNPLEAIKKGEEYVRTIASKNRGSDISRLARIALKATTRGDSTLSDLLNGENLEHIQNGLAGKEMPPNKAFAGLMDFFTNPLLNVYRATLETAASGISAPLSVLIAKTGLQAMGVPGKEINPITPALSAEPFIIGIAEHKQNPRMAKIADFLQSEIPALLTYPASAAYRVALNAAASGINEPVTTVLARIGTAIINSIPGEDRKNLAPLAEKVIEEISSGRQPLISNVAEEVVSAGTTLAEDDKKEEMTVLYQVALKEFEKTPPHSLREAAKRGFEMIEAMSNAKPPISSGIIASICRNYLETIRENSRDMKSEMIAGTALSLDESDGDGIPAVALYKASLEFLSSNTDENVQPAEYFRLGLSAMDSLKDSDNAPAQVAIARAFINMTNRQLPDGELKKSLEEVLKLDVNDEKTVDAHRKTLENLIKQFSPSAESIGH